jgi:hypothetical protein
LNGKNHKRYKAKEYETISFQLNSINNTVGIHYSATADNRTLLSEIIVAFPSAVWTANIGDVMPGPRILRRRSKVHHATQMVCTSTDFHLQRDVV